MYSLHESLQVALCDLVHVAICVSACCNVTQYTLHVPMPCCCISDLMQVATCDLVHM